MKASPRLSAPSKMPCKSWSLPAWDTCPGARKADNTPVDACSTCYALQGRYVFGAVKAAREHNKQDWQVPDWTDAMVAAIKQSPYFRWFDSGDMYCVELAIKIREVIERTPNTRHWIPTRAYKSPDILVILKTIAALPNAVVRYSSDSINGVMLAFGTNSAIIPHADDFKPAKGLSLCRAYTRGGKCADCRACWSDKVKTVFYIQHGRKVNPKMFTV